MQVNNRICQQDYLYENNNCGKVNIKEASKLVFPRLNKYKVIFSQFIPSISKIGLSSVFLLEGNGKYFAYCTEISKETGLPSEIVGDEYLDHVFGIGLFSDTKFGAMNKLNFTQKFQGLFKEEDFE